MSRPDDDGASPSSDVARALPALAPGRESLTPKDHAEAVAIFRSQVIGPLLTRGVLEHGDRSELLRQLAATPHRPPASSTSRHYSATTIERWFYAFRKGGLRALEPQRRSDRGHGRALGSALRDLVLGIREEHPSASAGLIRRTLIAQGRLDPHSISESTLRRLLQQEGLDRQTMRQGDPSGTRRRWEAASPDLLWHADVCHGPALRIGGRALPLRIHALLDDNSRYVPAIQACATEREIEMLCLLVKAIRQGRRMPQVLYLDNGSTYVGQTLSTACARLGIALKHARPYDPQARGKMERFWRTLREGCLDHLGPMSSLHDVQVRLLAFLDQHYLVSPHASLLGRTPAQVYQEGAPEEPAEVSESRLRQALVVRGRRRVRRDGTVDVGGTCFETTAGFLAGRVVTIARTLLDPASLPWIEAEEDQRFPLKRVDPVANGSRSTAERERDRGSAARPPRHSLDTPFDPPGALLDKMLGRHKEEA